MGRLKKNALSSSNTEAYKRTKTTYHWYSHSLVLVQFWDTYQTLFSIVKAFMSLPRLLSISPPPTSLYLTMLPRYVRTPVTPRSSQFAVIGEEILTFIIITIVFLWLISMAYLSAGVDARYRFPHVFVCESNARPFVTSRSTMCEKQVHQNHLIVLLLTVSSPSQCSG